MAVKMERVTSDFRTGFTVALLPLSSMHGSPPSEHPSSALHRKADVPEIHPCCPSTGIEMNSSTAEQSARKQTNQPPLARLSHPTAFVPAPAVIMVTIKTDTFFKINAQLTVNCKLQ